MAYGWGSGIIENGLKEKEVEKNDLASLLGWVQTPYPCMYIYSVKSWRTPQALILYYYCLVPLWFDIPFNHPLEF